MKTIIAGSRTITNQKLVDSVITAAQKHFQIQEVVSGTARGVDLCGETFATQNNIPIKRFPADWNKHGRAAGPIRNEQMAQYADALILIWDGKSRGAASMLRLARKYNLKIIKFATGS